MPSDRRSSSNGVKNLRAIFERQGSASPSSDWGDRSSSPGFCFGLDGQDDRSLSHYKKVTASFVSVEPVCPAAMADDNETPKSLCTEDEPSAHEHLNGDSHSGPSQLDVRAAVFKITKQGPAILLLRRNAERFPLHHGFDLPGTTIDLGKTSAHMALLKVIPRDTGLSPVTAFPKLPKSERVLDDGIAQTIIPIAIDSEDIDLNSNEYSEFIWVTQENLSGLEITASMVPVVGEALAFALAIGKESDQALSEVTNSVRDRGELLTPTTSPGGQSGGPDVLTLPMRERQSEHSEKIVSSIEDEDAQLQPVGVTNAHTISGTHVSSETYKEFETDMQVDRQNPGSSDIHSEEKGTYTNGNVDEPEEPLPVIDRPERLSTVNPTSKGRSLATTITRINGKPTSTAEVNPSKSTAPTRARDPGSSSGTLKARLGGRTSNPAQDSTMGPVQTKARSPTRSTRLSSHLTAPTASTSAKQEALPTINRTPSLRAKKPIGTSSHLLAPTASSAARGGPASKAEKPNVVVDRAAHSGRRDRASLAGTANETIRKHAPSNLRNSIQPSAAATLPTRQAEGNNYAPTRRTTGDDFLSRMTKPTAASSSRAQAHDRPENKNPVGQSSTERHAKFTSARSKPTAPTTGTLRRSAAAGAMQKAVVSGSKRTIIDVNTTNVPAPRTPVSNGISHEEKNALEDLEGGPSDTILNGQASVVDQDSSAYDHEPEKRKSNPLEDRMMETPDLGGGVIR